MEFSDSKKVKRGRKKGKKGRKEKEGRKDGEETLN